MAQGTVIWLTGLPSSGKTTLAELIARLLKEHATPVEVLDGDEIRRSISADLGFSAKDRQEHAVRVIF
jgi:adenylylsulfate kinase